MKKANGYYNETNIKFFSDLLKEEREKIERGEIGNVTISHGNVKMGDVPSVSLLPFVTCAGSCADSCGGKCYAAKMCIQHGRGKGATVARSYAKNTALYMYAPAIFWMDVERAIMAARYFRFHVSGDIPNAAYFEKVVEIAARQSKTEIMLFTKRFSIVNSFIDAGGVIPSNLHILFSGWENLTPENPHGLPETAVIMPGAEVPENYLLCGGNCFECGCRGVGCWQAKAGETIAFHLH